MKKILIATLILAAGIGSSFAQKPANCKSACPDNKECTKAVSPREPKCCIANPFEGLNLTQEQQTKIDALKAECKTRCDKAKADKKEQRAERASQQRTNRAADLKYDEETAQAVADAMFLSPQWTEGDRGVKTEEEILQSFIDNNPAYEQEIRQTFEEMGRTISLYSYTKDWMKYLKKRGYKLYILSNFSKPLYDRCQKELKFLELMDGGYMSWQIHCLKPEPEIFQKLLSDFQIDPSKAVFLDDMIDNVAEARAQGLNAKIGRAHV